MNLYISSIINGKTKAMTKVSDDDGDFHEAFRAVAQHARLTESQMTLGQFMAGDTQKPRMDFELSAEKPENFQDCRSSNKGEM